MLKPKLGEMLTLPNHDTIGDPETQDYHNTEETDDFIIGIFGFIMYKGINYLDYYVKIDIQLEKLTNGKWLEYTGKIKISIKKI